MEILSVVLSIISLLCMILASLIKGKRMKAILLLVCAGNLLTAISYACVGSWNGMASCIVGAITTLINYFYESRDMRIPKWLLGIYALAFVVANLIVFEEWQDIFAIIASLLFVLGTAQPNGKGYRFFMTMNSGIWCTFDILKSAWGPLAQHSILLAFTLIGMVIHDRRKSCEK